MQDQTGWKNIRAEEEQRTAARPKQHEDEEEDTGIRPKKTKDKQKADRSSEECDARRSARPQEEQHTCGTDNCSTDETTRRRGIRHKADKDKRQTKSRQEF